jgi:hypothetical protein
LGLQCRLLRKNPLYSKVIFCKLFNPLDYAFRNVPISIIWRLRGAIGLLAYWLFGFLAFWLFGFLAYQATHFLEQFR